MSSLPLQTRLKMGLTAIVSVVLGACMTQDFTHRANIGSHGEANDSAGNMVHSPEASDFEGNDSMQNLAPHQEMEIRKIIDGYLYMVYSHPLSQDGAEPAGTAVMLVNAYLVDTGIEYVEEERVRAVVRDTMTHMPAGDGASILRRVANILKVDIYFDIQAEMGRVERKGTDTAWASVRVRGFDAYTGAERGDAFSRHESQETELHALKAAVDTAIPEALLQSRILAARELAKGTRYEIVIQNTSDLELMRSFTEALERKVISIHQASYSKAETRYVLNMIGRAADLEDLIYDVAGQISGLENVSLLFQHGNSFTFASGI